MDDIVTEALGSILRVQFAAHPREGGVVTNEFTYRFVPAKTR
jgi:hypothetical protein